MSLDGDEDVNDRLRGRGNFGAVSATARRLAAAGLRPVVNTVLAATHLGGTPPPAGRAPRHGSDTAAPHPPPRSGWSLSSPGDGAHRRRVAGGIRAPPPGRFGRRRGRGQPGRLEEPARLAARSVQRRMLAADRGPDGSGVCLPHHLRRSGVRGWRHARARPWPRSGASRRPWPLSVRVPPAIERRARRATWSTRAAASVGCRPTTQPGSRREPAGPHRPVPLLRTRAARLRRPARRRTPQTHDGRRPVNRRDADTEFRSHAVRVHMRVLT